VSRDRYHHGDLRSALVEAAVGAARAGGAEAVGLNRLAAATGVSASAAYRHFPGGIEELLTAVGDVARAGLADRIVLRTGQTRGSRDPAVAARRRFRASGEAYVEYVLEEPGLFQVACRYDEGRRTPDGPYALLQRCIDDLVDTGVLPPRRRAEAAEAAWSAVHGVSVLLTEGPLRRLPAERQRAVVARVLDVVERGL
jgi:AcrR family transcriptional regulator